jgi:hypothetical protein
VTVVDNPGQGKDIVAKLMDFSHGRDVSPLSKTVTEAGLVIASLRDDVQRLENTKRELVNLVSELQISRRRWRMIAEGLATVGPQHDWQDSRILFEITKEQEDNDEK